MVMRGAALFALVLALGWARCHALAQARVVVTIADFFNDGALVLRGSSCETLLGANFPDHMCDTYFSVCMASAV